MVGFSNSAGAREGAWEWDPHALGSSRGSQRVAVEAFLPTGACSCLDGFCCGHRVALGYSASAGRGHIQSQGRPVLAHAPGLPRGSQKHHPCDVSSGQDQSFSHSIHLFYQWYHWSPESRRDLAKSPSRSRAKSGLKVSDLLTKSSHKPRFPAHAAPSLHEVNACDWEQRPVINSSCNLLSICSMPVAGLILYRDS